MCFEPTLMRVHLGCGLARQLKGHITKWAGMKDKPEESRSISIVKGVLVLYGRGVLEEQVKVLGRCYDAALSGRH